MAYDQRGQIAQPESKFVHYLEHDFLPGIAKSMSLTIWRMLVKAMADKNGTGMKTRQYKNGFQFICK